jgi:ABC-type dipeptide/oligopeptide/nickel transport system ATPase component
MKLNYIYLLVGKKGCGKSTIGLKLAQASTKKIIVISTDDNDLYEGFTKVGLDNLIYCKSSHIFCITEHAIKAIEILNNNFANAFVILEDAQKYINDNIQKEVNRFIINHRMRNFDVAFMYHCLQFVPPKICKQYTKIVLFKTTDVAGTTINSKFHNAHFITEKLTKVKTNKDQYFFQVINDTDG